MENVPPGQHGMQMMMPRQLCVGPTHSSMPTTESVMNVLPIIKISIVIMYDRGRSESSVNGERLVIFTQQVKEIESIPPTEDALPLAQHVLRVGYEASKRLKPHSYLAQQTLGGLGRWLMHSGI